MTLTVGPLRAEPGQKTRGTCPPTSAPLTVDVPLTLVNGTRPGPRVVITGGVHGGEFTGIDAATRLAGLLEPGRGARPGGHLPRRQPPGRLRGPAQHLPARRRQHQPRLPRRPGRRPHRAAGRLAVRAT